MSDELVFSEVDEELRRDRMRALWRRFGPFVIGAAVAVVALVGVSEGWRWWQDTNSARSSDLLYSALEAAQGGDLEAANSALDQTIAQGSGEYPLLARFRQASLLAKDGKADEAAAAYDIVASSTDEQRLRELALVLAAFELVDKGDIPAITARVGGIIGSDSPLRSSAREALGLTQYQAGDNQAAADSFQAILDDPATGSEQAGRMSVYLAQLKAEGVTPSSATPATEAVADPAETSGN